MLAGLLAVITLIAGYSRMALFDSGQFADRAVSTLQKQPVRDRIATDITDQAVIEANQDLIAIRPLIQTAVGGIVTSSPMRSIFRSAAEDFHRAVIRGEQDTATMLLADVGALAKSALRQQGVNTSGLFPRGLDTEVNLRKGTGDTARYVDAAEKLAERTFLLLLVTVLVLVAAVLISPDRRRAVILAALAIASAGALTLVLCAFARSSFVDGFSSPSDQAIARAVWDAFAGDLKSWALLTIGAGLLIAAAFASLIRPVTVRAGLDRAWHAVADTPTVSWRRAVRAVLFLAAGLLLVLEPRWVLEAVVVLIGCLTLFFGFQELMRIIYRPDEAPDRGPGSEGRRRLGMMGKGAVVAGLTFLLISAAGAAFAVSGATRPAERFGINECNGSKDLCDRPYDEVAYAMTHNSMAAQTISGWLFPQQEREVGRQLKDGIRGLSIDAYYGRKFGNRVKTELEASQLRQNLVALLGESGADAAQRIRDRLVETPGQKGGPREVWLCHGACEVGAVRMGETLTQIRDFLTANPAEVVTVIIQDEGVTPEDIAAEFEKAGLMSYVNRDVLGGNWPTLRQMIDSGGRLLVFGENDAGDPAVPWYHDAFEYIQETPFHFTSRSQFSCAANRGAADAPLFLINHWIDTSPAPQPSQAERVNQAGVLLARARKCETRRNRFPNYLSVDFYKRGDLFEVIDKLNGVDTRR